MIVLCFDAEAKIGRVFVGIFMGLQLQRIVGVENAQIILPILNAQDSDDARRSVIFYRLPCY